MYPDSCESTPREMNLSQEIWSRDLWFEGDYPLEAQLLSTQLDYNLGETLEPLGHAAFQREEHRSRWTLIIKSLASLLVHSFYFL